MFTTIVIICVIFWLIKKMINSYADHNRRKEGASGTPFARAYYAQARALFAEGDYEYLERGVTTKKEDAASAKYNAERAWSKDNASFLREQTRMAHLHAARAQVNASNWRHTERKKTDVPKELANKAAVAWEEAAEAWEAIAADHKTKENDGNA